jgi:hypothetical protein
MGHPTLTKPLPPQGLFISSIKPKAPKTHSNAWHHSRSTSKGTWIIFLVIRVLLLAFSRIPLVSALPTNPEGLYNPDLLLLPLPALLLPHQAAEW